MSRTSRQVIKGPQDRTQRAQRWTATLLTALLHMLFILLVMLAPPTTITAPQGEAGGSTMDVTLIDETLPPSPPEPVPPVRKPVSVKKPKAPRAIKRPLSTPVAQATAPMSPEAADSSTASPITAPEPADASRDAADAARPANSWIPPPRVHLDDAARANAALAAKLGRNRGHRNNPPPAGPNMGVDGFQVYYELDDEIRLRAWRDQGMTELFLPMPGTLRRMVCPLEVALRRGSSACRMVDMDSPELKSIGDAREVIKVQRVYQLGDVLWSGPGPYR